MCESGRGRWLVKSWIAVVFGVAMLLAVGASPAGSEIVARSAWSVVPSSDVGGVTGTSTLAGVACVGDGTCYAVGGANAKSPSATAGLDGLVPAGESPLIEKYTGKRWNVVTSPRFSGALYGIACVTSAWCVAVGGTTQEANGDANSVIETLDNGRWTKQLGPAVQPFSSNSDLLMAVSCDSTIECYAVGGITDTFAGGENLPQAPMIVRYSGGEWTVMPNPTTTFQGLLTTLSCTEAGCGALGEGQYSQLGAPVFLELSHGSWMMEAAPSDGATQGIACQGQTFGCVAVGFGSYPFKTAVATWADNKWRNVASANAARGASELQSVACEASFGCVGVGESSSVDSELDRMLIESSSGGWHLVAAPRVSAATSYVLSQTACAKEFCVAVGFSQDLGANGSQSDAPGKTLAIAGSANKA